MSLYLRELAKREADKKLKLQTEAGAWWLDKNILVKKIIICSSDYLGGLTSRADRERRAVVRFAPSGVFAVVTVIAY